MMNFTTHNTNEMYHSFASASKKLDENLYFGDVYVDDEGVAKTSIIKVDGAVEAVTLDKDLQEKFQHLVIASSAKVEAVAKMEVSSDE